MSLLLALGVTMIVFAWPLAAWRLSSVFWRDLAEAKLQRTDRRFRRTRVAYAGVYMIVGAVSVALWVASR